MCGLADAPGCDYETDMDAINTRFEHGALLVQISRRGRTSRQVSCKFLGDEDSVRSAEIYLNALLSPTGGNWRGEGWEERELPSKIAFARRYRKVLQSVNTEPAAG
jgi:hypothetical protein